MKNLVRPYFAEAKWFHQDHVPTMEYMAVALVSSAYEMLSATSFVGMGDLTTKDAFDWLLGGPKMVKASAMICWLMDDIVSHQVCHQEEYILILHVISPCRRLVS